MQIHLYDESKLEEEIWAKARRASRSKGGETGQLRNPSVSGALTTQKSAETFTQLSDVGGCCAYLLPDRRHGVFDECIEGLWVGVSLHVWSHNLGVLPEITLEGVTLPSSFCLDDVKGDALQ